LVASGVVPYCEEDVDVVELSFSLTRKKEQQQFHSNTTMIFDSYSRLLVDDEILVCQHSENFALNYSICVAIDYCLASMAEDLLMKIVPYRLIQMLSMSMLCSMESSSLVDSAVVVAAAAVVVVVVVVVAAAAVVVVVVVVDAVEVYDK
jgi:hypothetical protein